MKVNNVINFYSCKIPDNGVAEWLANEVCFVPLHIIMRAIWGANSVRSYEVNLSTKTFKLLKNANPIVRARAIRVLKLYLSIFLVIPATVIGTIIKGLAILCFKDVAAKNLLLSDPNADIIEKERVRIEQERKIQEERKKIIEKINVSDDQFLLPIHQKLSKPILAMVYEFLGIQGTLKCQGVCKNWYVKGKEDYLWKRLIHNLNIKPRKSESTLAETTDRALKFIKHWAEKNNELLSLLGIPAEHIYKIPYIADDKKLEALFPEYKNDKQFLAWYNVALITSGEVSKALLGQAPAAVVLINRVAHERNIFFFMNKKTEGKSEILRVNLVCIEKDWTQISKFQKGELEVRKMKPDEINWWRKLLSGVPCGQRYSDPDQNINWEDSSEITFELAPWPMV